MTLDDRQAMKVMLQIKIAVLSELVSSLQAVRDKSDLLLKQLEADWAIEAMNPAYAPKRGDAIEITEAFWAEKRRRNAADHFYERLWEIGTEAIVMDIRLLSDGIWYVIEAPGGGGTEVSLETACDMRQAWLMHHEVTNA